jgi:predicted ribosomally synthesized peptide with nif11-like leader
MSEEQIAALFAKLKDDAGLQEKLKGAADLDAAVALAKEAGFDVSKADLLKHQANQILELSDEELEKVAGGICVGGSVGWSERRDGTCGNWLGGETLPLSLLC